MLLVAVQLDGTLHLWDLQEGRLNVKSAVPSIQNIDGELGALPLLGAF